MDKIFKTCSSAFWTITSPCTAIFTATNAELVAKPGIVYSTVALVFDSSLPSFYLSAWENEVDLDPHFQIPINITLGEPGCSVNF